MKKILKAFIILCLVCIAVPKTYAQVSVSITVGTPPPPLRVYDMPEAPGDGYIWQPGYWAWDDVDGYYWVPGVWVAPPNPGLYWTPAYWGYVGGRYGFYPGYWGPHVGFYGGINYGYGYTGHGYYGGRWEGNRFSYNTAVVRVNRTVVHNTYVDRTVVVNNRVDRRSFNGGKGGVQARPRPQERVAMKEHHIAPTPNQISHQEAAHKDRSSFAKAGGGRPAPANRAAVERKNESPAGSRPNSHTAVTKPNAARADAREHSAARARVETKPRIETERRVTPKPSVTARTERAAPERRAPQPRAAAPRVQPQRAPQRAPQPRVAAPRVQPQPHAAPHAARPEHHR